MTSASSSNARQSTATSAITQDMLMAHPAYFEVLQQSARHLVGLYDLFPRVARLVSSQQKWLLSQSAYALHLERDPNDPLSGITASRLLDIMVKFGAASRNTATAFLAEMLAYKLIRDVPGNTSRRARPLEPTDISADAMQKWFRGQMHSLDLLDTGNRVAKLDADPSIFDRAQPIAAKRLIENRRWREPPDCIAAFVWTENGGLLLDDLMSRITVSGLPETKYEVAELSFSELSTHYGLSRTHIRRLFTRAEEHGWLGRHHGVGRKRRLWVSSGLVQAYKEWQAIKVSTLDDAFLIASTARPQRLSQPKLVQLLEPAN